MNIGYHNGFVDAHVHIEDARDLEAITAAGVAAVRDAGTRTGAGLAIRGTGRRGETPLVVSAGRALLKEGGYGSHFGTPVGTRNEIKSEIDRLKKAGAGIIKIMASGIVSLRHPGSITPGSFTAEEIEYIVDEAAQLGLSVMAHANGESAVISAARTGVRSIEHGFFMTKKALDAMAKAGTFWTPTVGALARASDSGAVSAEAKAYINGLIRTHLEMISRAHAMGIPLAIGTDCILPDREYEKAYAAELSFFEQAGLPRDIVLRIAADGGQKLLGI
ncbi:MAG TPA: amidohydrolase family protein [Nitrospirota bacterium]|nr:amidohydrolase family protein [Nitrospirota bacterium]